MRLGTALLAVVLFASSAFGEIQPLKGFDKKVYDGSLALYTTSESRGVKDKFTCSAQVIAKVDGGYEVLSAGHCTPASQEMPADMTFAVANNLGNTRHPVTLIAAKKDGSNDWAIFYYKTDKEYPVIPLGDENEVQLNSPTIDVNYSLGIAKEVSMGVVSSTVALSGPMKGFFEVTQFDSHGASGSSVVSEKTHKVIGIVIAGVDGTTTPTWVEPASSIAPQIKDLDVAHAPAYVAPPRVLEPYQDYH